MFSISGITVLAILKCLLLGCAAADQSIEARIGNWFYLASYHKKKMLGKSSREGFAIESVHLRGVRHRLLTIPLKTSAAALNLNTDWKEFDSVR